MPDETSPHSPANPARLENASTSSPTSQVSPMPSGSTQMDITPSSNQSISYPGSQLIYKSSSRCLRLLDMPDVILGRIIAFVARRTLYSKSNELPLELLPVAEVCKRMYFAVSASCFSLTFEPYMSWNQICAWLRLASPGLRIAQFSPIYKDDEEEQPEDADLLPPSSVFSMISFYAPKIEVLDLSGVHVSSAIDASALKGLLSMVRDTLTTLTLRDTGPSIKNVANAVVNARLYRLANFQINELRPDSGRELEMMLGSFQESVVECESNISALRSVHIELDPYNGSTHHSHSFFNNECMNTLYPSVVELCFASQNGGMLPVPYDFIRCFPGLTTLTLDYINIDSDRFCEMLSRRKTLQELRILDCCVIENRPADPNLPSLELLQVLEASAKVLTALWMPYRIFRETELGIMSYFTLPLKELGLIIAPGAAPAYRRLCMRLSNKLTRVGIFGTPTTRIQRFSPEAQHDIITGLGSLPLLSQIESIYLALSTVSWEKILEQAGSGLTNFSVEVNFEDCARGQFGTLIAIILQASIHNRNLVTFSVDSDKRPQLPSSSELGASLVQAIASLRHNSPHIRTGDLNVILDLWLKDFHREVSDN